MIGEESNIELAEYCNDKRKCLLGDMGVVVPKYFLVFTKKEQLPQRSAKLYCYSRIID